MSSSEGTILDATVLIDFRWLEEWNWLRERYGPLYVAQEVLDSDRLGDPEKEAATRHLESLVLDTEGMFASFADFRRREPLLSAADRSTLALACHRNLLCATDDGKMVEVCKTDHIPFIRTLRLLTEMVGTGHKKADEVAAMADILVNIRNKHIAPDVLQSWKASL